MAPITVCEAIRNARSQSGGKVAVIGAGITPLFTSKFEGPLQDDACKPGRLRLVWSQTPRLVPEILPSLDRAGIQEKLAELKRTTPLRWRSATAYKQTGCVLRRHGKKRSRQEWVVAYGVLEHKHGTTWLHVDEVLGLPGEAEAPAR